MNDMIDMSRFTEAKSDQLNADDLIGAPRTITITRVTGNDGDQPVSIFYEGDGGKPFKPCKTVRRILMGVWGRYANDYVGKSMTLYRDDSVTFGGLATGGIRISHMSGVDKETMIVVMKAKGKKVGVKVLPLQSQQRQSSTLTLDQARADMLAADTLDALKVVWTRKAMAPYRDDLGELLAERKAALEFDGGEGPADSQRGEPHTQSAYAAAVAEIDACPTADAIDSAVARLRPVMETDDEAADLFLHGEKVKQSKGWAA